MAIRLRTCNPCFNLWLEFGNVWHALIFYWTITTWTKGNSLALTVIPYKLQTLTDSTACGTYCFVCVMHSMTHKNRISKWVWCNERRERLLFFGNHIDRWTNRRACHVYARPKNEIAPKCLFAKSKVHAEHSRSFDSLLTHKQCTDRQWRQRRRPLRWPSSKQWMSDHL